MNLRWRSVLAPLGLGIAAIACIYAWDAHRGTETVEARLTQMSQALSEQHRALEHPSRAPRGAHRWGDVFTAIREQSSNHYDARDDDAPQADAGESEARGGQIVSREEAEQQADLDQEKRRRNLREASAKRAAALDEIRLAGVPNPSTFAAVTSAIRDNSLPLAKNPSDGCSEDLCRFTLDTAEDLRAVDANAIRRITKAGEFANVAIMRLPSGQVELFGARAGVSLNP